MASALTVEEAEQLKEGQKLLYRGSYEVEYLGPSDPRTSDPGVVYVKVTAVRAELLHASFQVGDKILAEPKELVRL